MTLLFTNPSYTILPITDSTVKYDPVKALMPVARVGTYGLPIVVSTRLPVNNLNEFIAYAKKNPGKLSYGSAGMGSGAHLAGEYFQSLTGTAMVHVPYKSTSAAIIDVAGGVLDLTFDATAKPYADAGKVKIIAVTGDHRDPRLPNVPTAAESGLKDFVLGSWLGLFAPVGTPAPVVERLNKAVNAALADPSLVKQMEDMGITPASGPPSALANAVQQDVAIYRRIVTDARLTFKDETALTRYANLSAMVAVGDGGQADHHGAAAPFTPDERRRHAAPSCAKRCGGRWSRNSYAPLRSIITRCTTPTHHLLQESMQYLSKTALLR